MKKILVLTFATLLGVSSAFADTCGKALIPTFSPYQAVKLCSTFIGTSTWSASLLPGTDNSYDLGSAAKQVRSLYVGTSIIESSGAGGFMVGKTSIAADAGVPGGYVFSDANGSDQFELAQGSNDSVGGILDILKSRKVDGTADTIVQSGDTVGTIKFKGANGTTFDTAAQIVAKIDATPGAATDMPGSLDFQVSADGSSTPSSVLKLTNDKLATFTGAIKSTATLLGWQVRAGANTACSTTCGAGKGCAFGYDIGTTALVDCSSALADSCVCSF